MTEIVLPESALDANALRKVLSQVSVTVREFRLFEPEVQQQLDQISSALNELHHGNLFHDIIVQSAAGARDDGLPLSDAQAVMIASGFDLLELPEQAKYVRCCVEIMGDVLEGRLTEPEGRIRETELKAS